MRAFYELDTDYALMEGMDQGYKYLGIYPVQESSERVNDKKLGKKLQPLEKLVQRGRTKGLRLPQSSLEYLGVGEDAKVKLVGMLDYFEVWKPQDFENHLSSINMEELLQLMQSKGYNM